MTKRIPFKEIDIGENESLGLGGNVFVVKDGDELYAYENACPHLGLGLEFQSNQFLNVDKSYIQCATHGALFEKKTGLCVHGPCQGESLTQYPIEKVEDRCLVLKNK